MIGNPPWGASFSDDNGFFGRRFQATKSTTDSFALFVELSLEKTKMNGLIGYIIPSGWQTGSSYIQFRKVVLTTATLDSVVNLPYNVFPDAYVDSSIFCLRKKKDIGHRGDIITGEMGILNFDRKESVSRIDDTDSRFFELNYSQWFSDSLDPDNEFAFLSYLGPRGLNIAQKVVNSSISLSSVADVQRGITPFELVDEKKGHNYLPGLDGGLRRYHYGFSGEQFVRYDSSIAEYKPERYFKGDRILLRELISRQFRLQAIEAGEDFVTNKSYQSILQTNDRYPTGYVLAILNSKLLSYYHISQSAIALRDDFPKIVLAETRRLPLREVHTTTNTDKLEELVSAGKRCYSDCLSTEEHQLFIDFIDERHREEPPQDDVVRGLLSFLAEQMMDYFDERESLNTNLLDYLGRYSDGKSLGEMYMPPSGLSDSILVETKEDREGLRIGSVSTESKADETIIMATVRYKPENQQEYETDRWGYTETGPIPAMKFVELSEVKQTLVEEFVQTAVEKAEGFAGFREKATTRKSIIDRLEELTLPAVEDIETGIRRYRTIKQRANELDKNIRFTDDLIDNTIYKLYDMTDEEMQVIEESRVTTRF